MAAETCPAGEDELADPAMPSGVRLADPRREARLMRGLRYADCPIAAVADRSGRVARPETHVHAESAMAAL